MLNRFARNIFNIGAGLFIFLSGIISSAVAAAIISKSDSWNDLTAEFDTGKESQLNEMNKLEVSISKTEASTESTQSEKNVVPSGRITEGLDL